MEEGLQHEEDWEGRPLWLLLPRASALKQPGVLHHCYPQTPPPTWGPAEPPSLPRPPVQWAARQQAGTRALAAKQRVRRAAWW